MGWNGWRSGLGIWVALIALGTSMTAWAVQSEVGTNDFCISDAGPTGDITNIVNLPSVAHNATDNEYLVVWHGQDNTGTLGPTEYEIFGQLLDANGNEIGPNDFRISDMGPDGDGNFYALNPNVTWNAASNEYLVVWHGDDNAGALVNGEREIYGQRLDANGYEVGINDFRISDVGVDGDTDFGAFEPQVACNASDNEYLVVWCGNDNALSVSPEVEIYGQRLDASGAEIGVNDFRISDMGLEGDNTPGAWYPAVAWNAVSEEYLVVWNGADDDGGPVNTDNESEIWGQRLDADGAEVGSNDFRISEMGIDGSHSGAALHPLVAWNANENEYLVVWFGDDVLPPLVQGEWEIHGQRLDAAGNEIGVDDFRISDMGDLGDWNYMNGDHNALGVAWSAALDEYLVVWASDDNVFPLVHAEYEIFGQALDASGAEIGSNDFRISDMGPDGDTSYHATGPTVVWGADSNEYLVIWRGRDDSFAPGEQEIFGQRLNAETVPVELSVLGAR
jgi:hypothetical protein